MKKPKDTTVTKFCLDYFAMYDHAAHDWVDENGTRRFCTGYTKNPLVNIGRILHCGSVDSQHVGHAWSGKSGVVYWCSGEATQFKSVQDHDPVNHPSHYTSHPSGVECIEVTRHMNFNLGNVVKYIWRAGMKDEAPTIQDLEKAAWYLNDEIEKRKKEQ